MVMDSKRAVGLVTTLFVAAIMGAFLFPLAIGEMSGPEEQTVTLETGETVELQPGLNLTLDSTTDATNASYTVSANNDTASTTVNVGANASVTVDGEEVTIGVTEATISGATAEVDYPATYGWGGGARALWAIIPVILVLALFLWFVFVAVRRL